MKWTFLPNGDWQAVGKNGDFLIWFKRVGNMRLYSARYRSKDQKKSFFLPMQRSVKAMKILCESNAYWEE